MNNFINQIIPTIWGFRFILVLILACVLFYIVDRSKGKAKLGSLMLSAKMLAKKEVLGSGEEQENWVVDEAYKILPITWTLFPRNKMKGIVHYLYLNAKDYLDDGVMNGTNGTEINASTSTTASQTLKSMVDQTINISEIKAKTEIDKAVKEEIGKVVEDKGIEEKVSANADQVVTEANKIVDGLGNAIPASTESQKIDV